jgi:hypothetical protein
MTKEQLSSLPDDVRIPAELLLERLKEISLPVHDILLPEEGGIIFVFEGVTPANIVMTADVEIESDGTTSASIIPYYSPSGREDDFTVFQSEETPIELWEIEEPPPFEETLSIIKDRLRIQ